MRVFCDAGLPVCPQLGTHAAMGDSESGFMESGGCFRASRTLRPLLCAVSAAVMTMSAPVLAATHKTHHHKTTHHKTAHATAHHTASGHHKGAAHTTHHKAHHPVSHPTHHTGSSGTAAKVAAGAAAGAAAAVVTAPPAVAGPEKGTNTGLPIPRYAALRADKVYMRRGPGQRYPIDWVYRRRGLPVKIEREFDVWRLVETSDGTKGWVHQATLSGRRSFLIPGEAADSAMTASDGAAAHKPPAHQDSQIIGHVASEEDARSMHGVVLLHAAATESSAVAAVLKPGAVGNLKECPAGSGWCHVAINGYSGWLEKRLFWGLLPGEVVGPS